MAEADDQIGNPASASEGQRERDKEEQQGEHHGGTQPHTSSVLPQVKEDAICVLQQHTLLYT